MTPDEKPEMARILTGLSQMFGHAMTAEQYELWWNVMREWELADFRAAASHLATTCRFMPRPADFHDLRKAAKPAVAEAWQMARNSIQYTPHGYIEKPGIDPLIAAALRVIGGANALAMCPTDKITFLEKRFSDAYANLDATTVTRAALPSVAAPRISDEQAAANRKRLSQLLELAS